MYSLTAAKRMTQNEKKILTLLCHHNFNKTLNINNSLVFYHRQTSIQM